MKKSNISGINSYQVAINDIHRGLVVNPSREDLFSDKFIGWLRKVGVSPVRFGPDRLRATIRLAFEAVVNCHDHADRKPWPLMFAIPPAINSTFVLATVAFGDGDTIWVMISDDGVGVAARQSQDPTIGERDFEEELSYVEQAIADRGSCKIFAGDCQIRGTPGYGYTSITDAIVSLGVRAVLHTGRVKMTCNPGDYKFLADPGGPHPFLRGTRLAVDIPIDAPHQEPDVPERQADAKLPSPYALADRCQEMAIRQAPEARELRSLIMECRSKIIADARRHEEMCDRLASLRKLLDQPYPET